MYGLLTISAIIWYQNKNFFFFEIRGIAITPSICQYCNLTTSIRDFIIKCKYLNNNKIFVNNRPPWFI